LHVQVDAKPHTIEDEIGLKLIAPTDDWQQRPDMKFTKRLRASVVARARFIDDLIIEQSKQEINQYVILGAGQYQQKIWKNFILKTEPTIFTGKRRSIFVGNNINSKKIQMNNTNPKVDWFFDKAEKWKKEFEKLRMIILDCGLDEELKWGQACYMFEGRNIVLIHGFKEYCALLFFKGALLNDPEGILIQQTENVQSARQIRFTNLKEIAEEERIIKAYIYEAIEVERAGLHVKLKKTSEFKMPEEFKNKLDKKPALKKAFDALTPGRQRAYIFHFSQPKLSKTRESRIEKYTPHILDGKGLDD
jgi:uncharacterized protein YdeI (YjbR/CyaY-like superfamily)